MNGMGTLTICAAIYLSILLFIAYTIRKKGVSKFWERYTYALSLGVYCTGWTLYGSVGLATEGGWQFLPVYLGPTLCALTWGFFLRKLIVVSKHHRVSSIADLLAARFGGDRTVGMIATLIGVVVVIPYISIQIKVISESLALLVGGTEAIFSFTSIGLLQRPSFYLTIVMILLATVLGARRLDPNERTGGMAGALALESIFKLIVFLSVGLFVVYGLSGSWSNLWIESEQTVDLPKWLTIGGEYGLDGWSWWWLTFISGAAALLLPRQFHVAVVGNRDPDHVRTAAWVFPLYLLLINLFVVPIALAGLNRLGAATPSDFYVLAIPVSAGEQTLSILIALAGFSAAMAMIIVSTIALSLMLMNNLISPILLAQPKVALWRQDLPDRLLALRRVTIAALLIVSYGYYFSISETESLISIGLISFAGIVQLLPAVLAALYWSSVSRTGVIGGLVCGFLLWAYLLQSFTLVNAGVFPTTLLSEGPFGMSWLSPQSFLGVPEGHPVARAAFWSLLVNVLVMVIVSFRQNLSPAAIATADEFINVERYTSEVSGVLAEARKANTSDLLLLLYRYLGNDSAIERLDYYQRIYGIDPRQNQISSERFIDYVERHLAGAVGSPSARLAVSSISKADMAAPLLRTLDKNRELESNLTVLESQRLQLEQTADELRQANDSLRQLDELKEEFVATVSHELRTPITSIRALSQLLAEHPDLPEEKRNRFHQTILSECDRVNRLVTQVLNITAVEQLAIPNRPTSLQAALDQAAGVIEPLAEKAGLVFKTEIETSEVLVLAEGDRLVQVFVNLLGNSIKFTHPPTGSILLHATTTGVGIVRIEVRDNGSGIHEERQASVFEKFAQADFKGAQKPLGNGLGLYITKTIVDHYGGRIGLRSQVGIGTTVWVELPIYEFQR